LTKEQRAVEFTEPIRIHEELGLGKFAFWRPPYGGTTPEIRKEGEALGMAEAMWDLDTKDFETPDPKKIASQAEGMKAGDILLMHDGKPQTLAALPIVINHYYEQGLCWGKLATTDKDRKAENGKFYNVHAVAP
jgi:peptidoglycan/xylan/chitin deacetylase (PgdA/CDA1 family)